jgi:capsule polysaccharide modification protein KpsS
MSTAKDMPATKPAQTFDVPWNYGRYRVVIARRVTEEEQISIECYESSRQDAEHTFAQFMERMREHMVAHNERVVLVHQDRLIKLERQIEHRAEEIRDLDEQIAQRKSQLGILHTGNGEALDDD